MKNNLDKEIEQAKELARQIIVHHFGSKPRRMRHKASGLSNFVFTVAHPEGDFIVRISFDPARLNSYIKEQWAQSRALEAGVPTSEILEVGNDVIGHPFMISRRVAGQEATFHPNRASILREMGHFASLINAIPTTGFGSTFDWSNNQLSHNETLAEFLDKELQVEGKLEILKKRKMIDEKQLKTLKSIFRETIKGKHEARLSHGDIRLKNVIVDEEGEIKAILDWEKATSNLAAPWELSLALHDLSIDEKQEFLISYGLTEKKIRELAPLIKAFNLINYAPIIEGMAQANDSTGLENYRLRLNGILDLYSI